MLGYRLRKLFTMLSGLVLQYSISVMFQIQIESSDENRCLMSAYCNLAGLYPPDNDQRFNQSLDWQPIPVHTRPAKEDNVSRLCSTLVRVTVHCLKLKNVLTVNIKMLC